VLYGGHIVVRWEVTSANFYFKISGSEYANNARKPGMPIVLSFPVGELKP